MGEGPDLQNLGHRLGYGDEPEADESLHVGRRININETNASSTRADARSRTQAARRSQDASSPPSIPMTTTGTSALPSARETQRDGHGPPPQAMVPTTGNTPTDADRR